MVRKSSEKSRQEVEEDGTAGGAGEGHHHSECQHQVHHHPEVEQGVPGLLQGSNGVVTARHASGGRQAD